MHISKFPIVLVLFVLIFSNSDAKPKDRLAVKYGQDKVKDTLRIMSYNIHHCNPPSKKGLIDIDAIVNTIRNQNPDIVALQEVDVKTRRSGKLNQAKEIAKRLNMKYRFGGAITYDGGDYGVAILSKYPIKKFKVHRLPSEVPVKEARIMVKAVIELDNNQSIVFGCTHLDVEKVSNREIQIAEINRIVAEQTMPFIIAGDFNAVPESSVIKALDKQFQRTCEQCAPTIPQLKPKRAIDFIAFTQKEKFKVLSHEVINETYASDHRPIFSVLEYNP